MNPYVEARREYQDRYGNEAKSRRNWQITASCLLSLNLLQGSASVIEAQKDEIVPWIVEVDCKSRPTAVSPAQRDTSEIPGLERIIQATLTTVIQDSRRVIIDPIAAKAIFTKVYAHVAGGAEKFLDDYYRANNPIQRAQSITVAPSVTSIIRVSDETFQIRWHEVTRDLSGTTLGKDDYEAIVTARRAPISDEQTLRLNPLGLFVVDIAWAKSIDIKP